MVNSEGWCKLGLPDTSVRIKGALLIKLFLGSPTRRLRRNAQRGQAMVEFTLVLPFLFFVLFGVFEFGLMMFSLGSARWTVAEAARIVSEQGIQTQTCSGVPGCVGIAGGPGAANGCNADCQAISAMRQGPLGTTSIATVDEVDITKLKVQANGSFINDTSCGGTTCQNTYKNISLVSAGAAKYDPLTRNVQLGNTDYVSVTIKFRYIWKTGIFAQFPVPNLQATYAVRLEPQRF